MARNAAIVRAASLIDAHGREVIACRALAGAGISGPDVRDMLLEAAGRRFGRHRAPEIIEVLSHKGSPYIAKETRLFTRRLGLKACFTPAGSAQANGISEACVKTLKRDCVRVTPLPYFATAPGDWKPDRGLQRPPRTQA